MRRWRVGRAGAGLVLMAGALCGYGCVTSGPEPREAPRPIPEQPAGVVPSRMVFSVGSFVTDSDGNGRADTFDVSVYLFAANYPIAVAVPGTLVFTMSDRAGKLLARWTFEPEKTAKMIKQFLPGWGYSLQLSLLDVGGDKFEPQTAELSCEFVPLTGAVIRPAGATRVQLGRLR